MCMEVINAHNERDDPMFSVAISEHEPAAIYPPGVETQLVPGRMLQPWVEKEIREQWY